jgi:hypothetical protein
VGDWHHDWDAERGRLQSCASNLVAAVVGRSGWILHLTNRDLLTLSKRRSRRLVVKLPLSVRSCVGTPTFTPTESAYEPPILTIVLLVPRSVRPSLLGNDDDYVNLNLV